MSTRHEISVLGIGTYRWKCSCGKRGPREYGYVGLAEAAGRTHAEARQGGRR